MSIDEFMFTELRWHKSIINNSFDVYFNWDSEHFLERTFIHKTVDENKNKIDRIRMCLVQMNVIARETYFDML